MLSFFFTVIKCGRKHSEAYAPTGFAPTRCCCNLPSKAPSSKLLPTGHKSPISTLTMLQTEPLTSQTTMSPLFLFIDNC